MDIISLKLFIFAPLIMGIIFLLPIFSGHEVLIRRIAKTFAGVHFLYAVLLYVFFDSSLVNNFQTEVTFFGEPWISSLGIRLSFGLDAISLFLVILTSLIVLMACVASKGVIKSKHSLYYALIFILQTSILGVFSAKDMFVFFMFWELELIPMYFLISLWGNGNCKKSAMKFLLYTFIGSLFLLCGLLMLYNFNFIATSELSADISSISLDMDSSPLYLQIIASILILFGFAVKLPIIPFHTWLPNAHVDAPTPVSMLLAGLLLKMVAYGIIRFNIQVLPDAFLFLVPYLAVFAMLNILFTAIVAYNQSDIKKIVAYSSISSMGIVLLGLCSLNILGLTGAVYLVLAHGIVASALFFIVGAIYKRTKTREISQLGGLVTVMPRLAGFAMIFILAGIGIPLTMPFIGEILAFFGAFWTDILNNYLIQVMTLLSIFVLVLSACYALRLMHKTFYGSLLERWNNLSDLTNHEFFVLFSLSVVVIVFGLVPMPIINTTLPILNALLGSFGG